MQDNWLIIMQKLLIFLLRVCLGFVYFTKTKKKFVESAVGKRKI